MNEQLATVGIQQTFDYEGAGCRYHVSATDTWAVYIIVDRLHHDTVDPYTSFKSATTDALAVSGVGDEAFAFRDALGRYKLVLSTGRRTVLVESPGAPKKRTGDGTSEPRGRVGDASGLVRVQRPSTP
jgi:hypothetical protein